MQKILLSPEAFIELVPSIGGNVDLDFYVPSVRIAQELFVKPALGKLLYNKIQTDFLADTLTGDYATLYEDYVQYMIAYYGAAHFVSIHPLKIGNGGIQKLSSEFGEAAEKNEIDFLVQNFRNIAEHFTTECIKFLKEVNFPEYPNNVKPVNNLVGGWYLSDKAERVRDRGLPRIQNSIGTGLSTWYEGCSDC
jgi:hypothetical protein